MRCEDAVERIQAAGPRSSADLKAAFEHAASCADCSAAVAALDAVRLLRNEPPPAADGALERALDRAFASAPKERFRRGFVSGLASGAALAAALGAVAVGVWMYTADDSEGTAPEVRVALNQPRAVTVTFESPEPLVDAAVRIELRGAVALDGYDGERELRWSTNLDRGINQLTLPVIALDASGGQLLVEVAHGAKRRTFVIDVRAPARG